MTGFTRIFVKKHFIETLAFKSKFRKPRVIANNLITQYFKLELGRSSAGDSRRKELFFISIATCLWLAAVSRARQ